MKKLNTSEGQSLVETALVLFLLLIILLGITEFARAWFTKNSYKNAVRHGARIAVVTPNLPVSDQCPPPPDQSCGNNPAPAVIADAVLSQPGVSSTATSTESCFTNKASDPNANLDTGDAVRVCANFDGTDFFIVGGAPWPWSSDLIFDVSASMRYEQ
jgi:Flp pilus assembly protein TadG